MFKTLANAWKIPELRRKLLFTLLILVIYRFGAQIQMPYINHSALETWKQTVSGSMFEYLNLISGDAFSKATLFALSISPYIMLQAMVTKKRISKMQWKKYVLQLQTNRIVHIL